MAKKQTITFTALPNGVAPNGKLRLSVFVSPRLWTDAGPTTEVSLTEFPDWVDWPSTALTFGAKFGGSDATGVVRVGPAPRSDLWAGLFPDGTSLRPRTFDTAITLTHIQSYSVKDVHSAIRGIYAYFAKNNPDDFPSVADLLDNDGPLYDIATPFFPPNDIPEPPPIKAVMRTTSVTYDALHAVETYHKPFLPTKQTIAPPEPDFHQMLAALGRYPALMRMLGLVHDLEIDHPGAIGATTVEATASWSGAPAMPHMKTRCFIGASAFYATPRASGPDLSSDGLGMLKFDDADAYEIVQVNHDGAAIRTLRFAETLVRATFDPADPVYVLAKDAKKAKVYKTDDTPTAYALPSTTTAGIAVARVDSADKLKTSLAAQAAKNTTLEALGDVLLDAEDVTRGYAIDVHDSQSNAWHSLCERVGTYTIGGTQLPAVQDEGFISFGLATPADGTTADSKMPETLFNWYGWSLAAPKPGKAMDEDGQPTAVQPTNTTDFDLKATFVANPGSLPKLRFGTAYRLRARAVDLAGNATPRASVTGFANATAAVTFGRFEPVSSPEVVLDDKLGEGESLGRVVIRSNFDTKADVARRHIAPPKAPETLAEALGSLDANGGLDAGAYRLLQQKDGGSWQAIGRPDPNHPGVFYVKEEDRKLPYLPDALSRGAVLRGLPGTSTPMKVGFGYDRKTWPDALLFTMLLREGTGAPAFADAPRYLVVELGKGDTATVRLSSFLDPDRGDVDRMGLLRWLEQEFPDAVDAFRAQVANGTHWMVTPFKTLTLVHAVRQPLLRPKYTSLTATKALGNTFATLADPSMELSRKSTSRLDIVAQWTEMIDAPANAGPLSVPTSSRPFQVNVPLAPSPAQETTLSISGKHEFGDTKYRRVSYSAHAVSRFAEYFAERKDGVKLSAGSPVKINAPVVDDGENWGGVVAGSEIVAAADRTARYARDVDYTMDYMAGTLTPSASLDGKTVNITFVAPPIARKTASPLDLDVLSSARPDAPKVLYLVPTFGWNQTFNKEGTSYVSERRGGGLRAYLDRPWFSSGEGELLGVVIWSGATPPPDSAKPFVSDWGLDPVYKSAATTAAPSVGAFTMATSSKTSGLSLEEMPGVTSLQVAGHPVGYDTERKLWYCDLEIDAGQSYFPFVRLALARYQPNSVQDAHLSRVVLADFVQLTANRTASLTRDPKQSDVFNVAVSGLSYSLLQNAAGPSVVEVSVEGRGTKVDASDNGELGWEQVPGTAHALTPSAGPGGTTVWTGQAILPKAPPGRYRIVITEFEKFGPSAAERRLVYADAIVIDK